jgi:hypothetical protein
MVKFPDDMPYGAYLGERCIEVGDCWEWQKAMAKGTTPTFSTPRGQGTRTTLSVRVLIADYKRLRRRGASKAATTCSNDYCCNPAHVIIKSHSATILKAYKENPIAWQNPVRIKKLQQGARARAGKLNEAIVREMRNSHESCKTLARRHGVATSTVINIKAGKSWRDVSGNPWAGLLTRGA